MSELGSNQGQDENKNAPVFDSANLAEKQKAEHFTNVEGNEARAKQAERQAEVAKKKAEAAHAGEIKKAAKQAEHFTNVEGSEARAKAAERQAEAVKKKAEAAHANEIKKVAKKEAGGSKGGILNFLFGGWRKWAWVAVLIIALGVCVFVYYLSTGTISEQQANKKAESFKESCSIEDAESSYCFEALDDFENYISNERNLDTKIKLLKEYEEYVMLEYGDAGRVEAFLDKNKNNGYSDENKQALCKIYKDMYYKADNWEGYFNDCEF